MAQGDVITDNGSAPPAEPATAPPSPAALELPDVIEVTAGDLQRFPSPGTQRALKAETGRDYMAMVGPNADSADRTQTQIWVVLRRRFPTVRWADCAEVSMAVVDTDTPTAPPNPTFPPPSATSPHSVDSGG